MEIKYIAFDSFGIKSSCFQVKTADCTITVDPGIASETNSFPLTMSEKSILDEKYYRAISKAIHSSNIIIFTHYHWDHVDPNPKLYKNKLLLVKDPKKHINRSQKERSAELLPKIKAEIRIADAQKFRFGKTEIRFSKALWHGKINTGLGYVVMVTIDDKKERLLYTSDLNGIYISKYVNLIAKEKPNYIIFDGAPTYLLGYIMSFENLKKCIKNTIKLLEKTSAKLYIIDHHLLRDYRYKELYYEAFQKAKKLKKKLITAAEVIGKKPKVIEGYQKNGPTRWKEWETLTFKKLDKIIKHAKAIAKK